MANQYAAKPQRHIVAGLTGLALGLAALGLHAGASAAQEGAAMYHQALVKAAGQSHALAEICGTGSASELAQSKARIKTKLVGEGYNAASFDTEYESVRSGMLAKAKAEPAKAQKSCEQLKAMGKQMEQQLKSGGGAKP